MPQLVISSDLIKANPMNTELSRPQGVVLGRSLSFCECASWPVWV